MNLCRFMKPSCKSVDVHSLSKSPTTCFCTFLEVIQFVYKNPVFKVSCRGVSLCDCHGLICLKGSVHPKMSNSFIWYLSWVIQISEEDISSHKNCLHVFINEALQTSFLNLVNWPFNGVLCGGNTSLFPEDNFWTPWTCHPAHLWVSFSPVPSHALRALDDRAFLACSSRWLSRRWLMTLVVARSLRSLRARRRSWRSWGIFPPWARISFSLWMGVLVRVKSQMVGRGSIPTWHRRMDGK